MAYTAHQLKESIEKLYGDIDACITDLIRARLNKDAEGEGKALFKMEGLMVATEQELTCIGDYLEETDGKALLYAINKTEERTRKEIVNKACEWLMNYFVFDNTLMSASGCDLFLRRFREGIGTNLENCEK